MSGFAHDNHLFSMSKSSWEAEDKELNDYKWTFRLDLWLGGEKCSYRSMLVLL